MKIGALIIGDELLSGKHQDRHFSHLQSLLKGRGLELSWSLITGDSVDDLERALRFSSTSEDLVFSFGGIGATPDDRTRQVAASVFNVELYPHPDAIREIEGQYGDAAYPNRILMGHLPKGSRIIPNPVNRVPGFSFEHHHFMPGFPELAWPMTEWILDNLYADLRDLKPKVERIIDIIDGRESELLDTMNLIVKQFPAVFLSSLPSFKNGLPAIEFSLRGNPADVEQGMQVMLETLQQQNLVWTERG